MVPDVDGELVTLVVTDDVTVDVNDDVTVVCSHPPKLPSTNDSSAEFNIPTVRSHRSSTFSTLSIVQPKGESVSGSSGPVNSERAAMSPALLSAQSSSSTSTARPSIVGPHVKDPPFPL